MARPFSQNTSRLRGRLLYGTQIQTGGDPRTQRHEVMGITCGIIGEYFNFPS